MKNLFFIDTIDKAILEAEATGDMKSEVPERLGHCAADLWNEFVAAAKACGGVPGHVMVLMQVLEGFLDGKPMLDKERSHHCYGRYGLWCFFFCRLRRLIDD